MATRSTKDINEATQQDLEEVPQMSSARAETIIHYRDQHGPFESIEQLNEVPGIGQIMAQQMAEFFTVRGGSRSGSRSSKSEEGSGSDGEEGENEGEGEEAKTSGGESQGENQQQRRTAGRKSSSSSSSRRSSQ